jgi:hypothetical protein
MSSQARQDKKMHDSIRRGLNRLTRVAVTAMVAGALASCSFDGGALNQPPESEYTQAEAYAPMEAAVADSIAVLPDFPGFGSRKWHENPCSHNGVDDPNYTNIEITYDFSEEISGSDLIREDYVAALREFWESQGYEITDDEERQRETRVDRSLAAEREDGISLWYTVGRIAGLIVNSGCVPVSDLSELEYIPPVGGIEPGGDKDNVDRYFPDGIPTDQAAAIDPFAEARTIAARVPFQSPQTYEDLL